MKKDLMEILACPVCKGELTLEISEEKDGEILSGTLHCVQEGIDYPIEEGIPNLLPPEKG